MRIIKKPHGRSLTDFLPLLPAEEILRDAVCMGEEAIIDSTRPSEMTEGNCVRAEFLRFLALGGDERVPVDACGVKLQGAWISNSLNLHGCDIPNSLILAECSFEKLAVFIDARIHGLLCLDGSQLPALHADRLVAKSSIFLRDGFKASGEVRLLGMLIDGDLSCTGGEFSNNGQHALLVDRANIRGDVYLLGGFKAGGTVRLLGTQIGGNLDCRGGELDGKGESALWADGADIQGDIFLREGFKASGTVSLAGAQIGGDIDCNGGKIDGNGKDALLADGADIQGDIFLREGFKAIGVVRLIGAQIGGDLDCCVGECNGNGESALLADRINIQGGVFLRHGFKASGTVRLVGAQIGGSLSCNGGEFDGNGKNALSVERAKIQGNVFLREGFKTCGTINLVSAAIGGNLICQDGQFNHVKSHAIVANGMSVSGSFQFMGFKDCVNGISLAGSRVGQLADDEASWGKDLILDGFVYEHFAGNAPTSARSRLEWLKKQRPGHLGKNFRPQPWKQLIRTLRSMGHDEDARKVAIAYEEQRRKAGVVNGILPRSFHKLFGLLIGYGYRPLRLLYIMLGVWLICAGVFWAAALNGVFAPSNPLIFHYEKYEHCRPGDPSMEQTSGTGNWYLCPELASEYTGFSPLAYSLDLILPLVDLQQEHDWAPYIPAPQADWFDELGSFSKYHWTRLLVWFEIIFGWVASLLLVAVVSGLTNRDKES